MEPKIEDLRTDQEKRQDAFARFLVNGSVGQKAKIFFAGNTLEVEMTSRVDNDLSGSGPGNVIVSFKYLGIDKTIPKKFAFNTCSAGINDTELIDIY